MPIDPSIYQNVGRVNPAAEIAGYINQYADQQNRLSQLARQNELQDYQLRAAQRAEAAIPEQKRQKDLQELSQGLAFGLDPAHGRDPQELMDLTYQEAKRRGLGDEDVAQLFAPWSGGRDTGSISSEYAARSMPQEAIKQKLEAQFRPPQKQAQSALSTTMAERSQIAMTNPNDPRLAIYDQLIEKMTTNAPQTQIVVGEGGAMKAVTIPKDGKGITVKDLGVTKPTLPGKGGTPEEKAMQLEQASLSSQQVLDQAEKLFLHPGRGTGTGASAWMSMIPGTEAKGFAANLETLKSQTFLPMVQALKGMGALSDAEGKKISASVGALDPAMPEKEFETSLKEVTQFLYKKGKAAGLNITLPEFAGEKAQKQPPAGWTLHTDANGNKAYVSPDGSQFQEVK